MTDSADAIRPVLASDLEPNTFNGFPEPFHSRMGPFEGRALGDHFGLTQFGAALETLPPGSQSALRHWHPKSDELVWMVAGELTLITNEGESALTSGMCVGFKAGVENGHHLVNRSSAPATFLVIGSRVEGDGVVYPDDDLQWQQQDDGSYKPAHKDGTPYPARNH